MKQNTTGHEQVTVSISMQCWHICWPSFTGCLITWNLRGAQTLTSHGHWCCFCRSSFRFGTSSRDDEVAGEWLGKEWGNESIHLENHGLWQAKNLLNLIPSLPHSLTKNQLVVCEGIRFLEYVSGKSVHRHMGRCFLRPSQRTRSRMAFFILAYSGVISTFRWLEPLGLKRWRRHKRHVTSVEVRKWFYGSQ